MQTFKEAYYMGKHRSAAWHADGGANDEGHSGSKFREVHKVYINGRHWKTFNDHAEAKKAHDSVKKKYPDKSVSMHQSYAESADMCNVCGQTPCNCTHIRESEMGDAAHATTMKHRILVTYSDPHHTASHMRKEKVQKHLLVPSTNKKTGESVYKGEAEELAKKHMKKQGYKVHGVEHVGLVTKKVNEEAEQIDELSSELLARYKEKAGLAAQAADKAKKYDIGHKRFKGILKATFKQFANDAKK